MAQEKNLQIPEKQINAALNDIVHNHGAEDIGQLEQVLIEQGKTLEELKQEIENQIKITKLVNTEVRAKILISQSEMEEYYQSHLPDYQEKDEVSARHILLAVPEDALPQEEARVKQKAQRIITQINQGADCQELMKSVSVLPGHSVGDLGYINLGELLPQLEQAIWDSTPGEVTLVRTHLGYHVVQVTDRKTHTLENDPQIKQAIEGILFKQKFNQQSQDWLNELRQRATIEIMP